MAFFEKLKNIFRKRGTSTSSPEELSRALVPSAASANLMGARARALARRIPFAHWAPYMLAGGIGLMLADATTLALRPKMIPTATPSARRPFRPEPNNSLVSRMEYTDITNRNIFNSDGVIPENMVAEEGKSGFDENIAVESTLPITLLGTIVHANPGKSVATLEVKTQSHGPLPYIPNDEIEGIAVLIKVERRKIYIRNLSTNRFEFIQIKDEGGGLKLTKASGPGPNIGIQAQGETNFQVQRSSLEGLMNDLPSLLTQARAVPKLGPGGKVECFKIVEIQEGSVFEKLGIRKDDCISSVNGEPVDSPTKAMELYNALRTQSNVSLGVDRGGTKTNLNYNIR